MSELTIVNVHASVKMHLLASASALAVLALTTSFDRAWAEDADHPTVWIDLGGQLEAMQGTSGTFSAPFMSPETIPDVYGDQTFAWKQKPPRFSFGGEGKIVFQPQGADWIFAAAVRFGRSNGTKHTHYQGPPVYGTFSTGFVLPLNAAAFSDSLNSQKQSHAIIDFSAGRDVGIGKFGRSGGSTIDIGVRAAQFSSKTETTIVGRPEVQVADTGKYATFNNYILEGHANRSFHGVGPSLAWNASAALLGNSEAGEVTVDWGINGAVLFGRQKAQVEHSTSAYNFNGNIPRRRGQTVPLYTHLHSTARSRSVTVPNLGGFAGVSMRKANAKVSLGYRADFFFGAMDTGIDARRTSDLGFHGPFATISIGLGG